MAEGGLILNKSKVTRVLIVDDSPSMRQLIRLSLSKDAEIEVVAEAADARAARDAVNLFRPDVMTLDVEMPEMDGLEFLRRLMRARPMPVVMVSSLTDRGSAAAVRALSLGAVECVAKPKGGPTAELFDGLADTLKMAAKARVRGKVATPSPFQEGKGEYRWNGKILLVGASTGGVEALETVLSQFPKNCPPTLITQHMPEQFLVNFAARLNKNCAPEIKLATHGESLCQGGVYIAPGGETHLHLGADVPVMTRLVPGPKQTGHRPSVDVMFSSALPHAPNVIAALLTGMGSDGAEGMRQLREKGAFCIAQDNESSVVYGMPRVACEKGGVDISLDLSEIAGKMLTMASGRFQGVPLQQEVG